MKWNNQKRSYTLLTMFFVLMACIAASAQIKRTAPPIRLTRAGTGTTTFDPKIHGFRFVNDFQNDVLPVADVRTGGLCGGMSYTALDYYFARMPIPTQDYRPANRTALQSYLYNREVDSLRNNLDKWGEIGFNPGGARNGEFFRWGLQGTNGGRLQELRSFIDRGIPVVLGLQGDGKTGNHQVVAIGYSLGRYKGDLKDYEGDLQITVYDPNYPKQVRTLYPDVPNQLYRYREGGGETWRTYFVDTNYNARNPPNLPNPVYPNDGYLHELVLGFQTGSDDLRGGNDNINLTVNLLDGTKQFYPNINLSARWLSNYAENARIVLSKPIAANQIRSLVLDDTFSGGTGGDNWDMQQLMVRGVGGGISQKIQTAGYKRFSGDDRELVVVVNSPAVGPGQVAQLVFEFHTGDDDLRGGRDNLNIEVQFANGKIQLLDNANRGANWRNNSTNTVTMLLDQPVPLNQIRNVVLRTTFSGGIGGDNWNMSSVQITAVGNGVKRGISHGFHHFSGSDRQLVIPVM